MPDYMVYIGDDDGAVNVEAFKIYTQAQQKKAVNSFTCERGILWI